MKSSRKYTIFGRPNQSRVIRFISGGATAIGGAAAGAMIGAAIAAPTGPGAVIGGAIGAVIGIVVGAFQAYGQLTSKCNP